MRLARRPRRGDYDPLGGDGEHPDEAQLARRPRPRARSGRRETYSGPLSAQKPGVGVYVDAAPGVNATRIEIRSRTPGWSGAIYGARKSLPDELPSDGWVKLADVEDAGRRERIGLPGSERMRYYLVWIDLAAGGLRARRALRDRPVRAASGAELFDTSATRSWPGR